MKLLKVEIDSTEKVAENIFLLSFKSPYLKKVSKPGQFLEVRINSSFSLRRPFSIHKVEGDKIYLIFKIRGKGTQTLSGKKRGEVLDILGPLGRGFNFFLKDSSYQEVILVAGGMGIAPLFFLAQRLGLPENCRKLLFLGTKSKKEIVLHRDFQSLGFKVFISSEDGSKGFKGTVTQNLNSYLKDNPLVLRKVFACGPREMLEGLVCLKDRYMDIEVSLENFMGCGIGICCACSIETEYGLRKVCKDGPVFNMEELKIF